MSPRRSYWHLEAFGRKPSRYEIVSSRLLYHPERGFSVSTPAGALHERFGRGSSITPVSWETFEDPRETTYSSYTKLQSSKETFVDGLFDLADETGELRRVPASWLALVVRVVAPLRYPMHALQMISSYVGSMAPSGRITLTALFQAADELRRVQRIAQLTHRLHTDHAALGGDDARTRWENDPIWQPMRELVERLLVTYDWAEAFVAMNLVVKPLFDGVFMMDVPTHAEAIAPTMLRGFCFSLAEDCRWHAEWSEQLAGLMNEKEANRRLIAMWVSAWTPRALHAIRAFAPVLDGDLLARREATFAKWLDRLDLPLPAGARP